MKLSIIKISILAIMVINIGTILKSQDLLQSPIQLIKEGSYDLNTYQIVNFDENLNFRLKESFYGSSSNPKLELNTGDYPILKELNHDKEYLIGLSISKERIIDIAGMGIFILEASPTIKRFVDLGIKEERISRKDLENVVKKISEYPVVNQRFIGLEILFKHSDTSLAEAFTRIGRRKLKKLFLNEQIDDLAKMYLFKSMQNVKQKWVLEIAKEIITHKMQIYNSELNHQQKLPTQLMQRAIISLKLGGKEEIELIKKLVLSKNQSISIKAFQVINSIDSKSAISFAEETVSNKNLQLDERTLRYLKNRIRSYYRKVKN